MSLCDPAGHVEAQVAPARLYLPVSHAVHGTWVVVVCVPAAQSAHSPLEGTELRGHDDEQTEAPGGLTPLVHAAHSAVPPAEAKPAAQLVHT